LVPSARASWSAKRVRQGTKHRQLTVVGKRQGTAGRHGKSATAEHSKAHHGRARRSTVPHRTAGHITARTPTSRQSEHNSNRTPNGGKTKPRQDCKKKTDRTVKNYTGGTRAQGGPESRLTFLGEYSYRMPLATAYQWRSGVVIRPTLCSRIR